MVYEACMMLSKHYSGPSRSLTEGALTEMNRRVHLTAKQTYRTQMKIFKIKRSKIDLSLF
jgi:hypothetical protein